MAPVSSTRRRASASASSKLGADEHGLGAVAQRRLDLRHRRVLRHEDRRVDAELARRRTRPPGRGCRRSPRSRPPRAPPARATRAMLTAPRILNEPVRCRFSALSSDLAARPARERVGAVDRRHARAVADPLARGLDVSECRAGLRRHRRPDRRRGGTRVSRIACTAVSGSSSRRSTRSSSRAQLGIVGDRALEMAARPRRGDGEHLGREVAPPALLERALGLEPGAVRRRSRPRARRCPSPRSASVSTIGGCGADGAEREHLPHVVRRRAARADGRAC